MSSTEQLIEQLSHDLKPVKAATRPYTLFMKWLGFIFVYLLVTLAILGFRPDISGKLLSTLFLSELVILALVIITTSLSAVLLSYPDMFQRRALLFIPVFPLVLFIATLVIEYISDMPPAPPPEHNIECLLAIMVLALFPALLMFVLLRRQATTHYYLAGMVSLLTAVSIGAIILRLSENTDSIIHLISWHYAPMAGFGIIGLWLGRKFLKW